MSEKVHVTEEPLKGWLRFEVEGSKPWFKTPVPRTVIRNARMLAEFLKKEHDKKRMLEVTGSEFSFKRRLGLRKGSQVSCEASPLECSSSGGQEEIVDEANIPTMHQSSVSTEGHERDVRQALSNINISQKVNIEERLMRSKEVVDHRKLLSHTSSLMDQFRSNDGYQTPENFLDVKEKLVASNDLRGLLSTLVKEEKIMDAFDLLFSDKCLTEISSLNSKCGPLVEFPAGVNENLYCKIVEYGMEKCPTLLSFTINMVVRRGEPVLPSHVLKVATLFSTICYVANQDLDGLVKLRSLSLQIDGLSNIGLDILSDMGLAQCARSLSNHRDMLSDLGPDLMKNSAFKCPYQSTIDNCDFLTEHLTIETVEKELIDTYGLNTKKLSKEEALALFHIDQVLFGKDLHKEERDHLMEVVAIAVARLLVAGRPDAAVMSKYLPSHHKHENSDKCLHPALS